MASGIFAVLDDIAALMDDVAVASKIATKKTAGILGDDLAVNAEKATGFLASREIPVLWAITKGSVLNKIIIVPAALLLNIFFPVAIKVILILGGFYLAYEGAEKVIAYFFHRSEAKEHITADDMTEEQSKEAEKQKIKSAVTTDFILSVEIVIIALGSVLDKELSVQILTVSVVALLATVGVYGIVALIVRMDDAGYKLIKRSGNKGFFAQLGHILVKSLPLVIKMLSVIGTIALLLVSGGIFVHNIDYLHHILPKFPVMVKEFVIGSIAGVMVVGLTTIIKKLITLVKKV
jgi:predicted DNA repair protein MutK